MRLLVCGGRYYKNHRTLDYILNRYYYRIEVIIHGDCPTGADALAKSWCRANGLPELPFPANWKRYRKADGPMRNTQMIVEGHPDCVIAFPGGNGTQNMIEQATHYHIPVIIL